MTQQSLPHTSCALTVAALVFFFGQRTVVAADPSADLRGSRPNIVLLMVDDMGYSDIGCFGAEIRTPNLDWLASQGTRLTQFYTNPVCTPTRASLLTGRYAHQAGLATNNTWPGYDHPKPEKELVDPNRKPRKKFWDHHQFPAYHTLRTDTCVTIGEAMRRAGYQTFLSGKWHVGDEPKYWPYNQRFDRSFVMIWGGGAHFKPPWCPYALDDKPFTEFPDDFYTTDHFFKYAMEFIESRDASKPFFLYLSPSAPHSPFQAWPDDIKKYDGVYDGGWDAIREARLAKQIQLGLYPGNTILPNHIDGQTTWADEKNQPAAADSMEVVAAMIDRVDQKLGDLIALLKRRGELENTIFFFFSDNGGTPTNLLPSKEAFHPWGQARSTPCAMQKGFVHEGGIRSPLIVSWPGRTQPGVLNLQHAGHVMDILPTCLDLAGADYPQDLPGRNIEPAEGTSLLPAIADSGHASERVLCWEFAGGNAVRAGDWKLVREFTAEYFGRGNVPGRTGTWALYNVRTDPGESHDLIAAHPEKARELEAAYLTWEKRVGVVPHETILKLQAEFKSQPPQP